jgi:high-affinity iron transporter
MLSGFLLALREGVEAALIVGIIFSITSQSDRKNGNRWIWLGVLAASIASIGVAAILEIVRFELEGNAEKIFEGFSLLLAAALLTGMIFWMKKHSQQQTLSIEKKIQSGRSDKALRWTLFWVTFIAVVREGIELALFLFSASKGQSPLQIILGTAIGIVVACFLGWLWFRSTKKLSLKVFFSVTNIFLIAIAAGMFSRAVGEFIELGWLPGIINPFYNISKFLSSESGFGGILQSLFGYNSSPALTQTIVYTVGLAVLLAITLLTTRREKKEL